MRKIARSTALMAVAFVGLASLSLALASCSSMDRDAVARVERVALVSLYCDRQVRTTDFKGDLADIGRILQSPAFDLKPVITGLADDFFSKYSARLPFAIVDEAKVLDSPAYARIAKGRGFDALFFSAPDDYAVIFPGDKDRMLEAISDVPEADAAVCLDASFELRKDGIEVLGAGTARVVANLHLAIVDRRGRSVVETYETGVSETSLTYMFGAIFDATQLASMCREAASAASRAMLSWIAAELGR